jgi:predicted PurR-regulated permease PerM
MSDLDAVEQRRARVTDALKVTALVILLTIALLAVLHFLGRIQTVTTILVGAVFFSYLVAPSIRTLRRRLPMWASVLLVYLGIALVFAIALSIIIPIALSELRQYTSDAPGLTAELKNDLSVNGPLFSRLPDAVKAYVSGLPAQISDVLTKNGLTISSGALSVIRSTASSLLLLILVPITAAYAITDGDWLKGAALGLVPSAGRPKFESFVTAVNSVLAGYIRGQLLVAAVVGLLVTVLLFSFHVRYALAIGIFAGLFELVPYLGAIAGAIPGVGIALLTNGWQNALFVALGFILINQLSGHVFSPLIVGDRVGLRPIFVLLALLAGGELLGLGGLLIAVPVAGIIRAIIVTFVPFDPSTLPAPPARPVPAPPPPSAPQQTVQTPSKT